MTPDPTPRPWEQVGWMHRPDERDRWNAAERAWNEMQERRASGEDVSSRSFDARYLRALGIQPL